MFERYTEKARRAIFFARYEASQVGSPVIDTEHLLLGLLREDKSLCRWLPRTDPGKIRQRIYEATPKNPPTSTAVDLPLSPSSQRVLKDAAKHADRLAHRQVGTEHLFLGLLDEEEGLAGKLLEEGGADAAIMRVGVDEPAEREGSSLRFDSGKINQSERRRFPGRAIEIHGVFRNIERVREAVQRRRMYNWHWDKREWKNADIVVEKGSGKVSFDLSLAADSEHFELVKEGWKKDHCFVCRWELYEPQSEDDRAHATGYSNGHDWLCTECFTKFFEGPDFFASSYSDIT